MSTKVQPKPSIGDLEDLMNRHEEGAIRVLPDGEVLILNSEEITQESLVIERERNALLLKEIRRLRNILKQIGDLSHKESVS